MRCSRHEPFMWYEHGNHPEIGSRLGALSWHTRRTDRVESKRNGATAIIFPTRDCSIIHKVCHGSLSVVDGIFINDNFVLAFAFRTESEAPYVSLREQVCKSSLLSPALRGSRFVRFSHSGIVLPLSRCSCIRDRAIARSFLSRSFRIKQFFPRRRHFRDKVARPFFFFHRGRPLSFLNFIAVSATYKLGNQ